MRQGPPPNDPVVDVLPRVNVLGVWVHDITRAGTLEMMERMIESRRPHLITTPNVDYIIKAQRDQRLLDILNGSTLAIPDGMGVVYASRLLRTPLQMNVGGRLMVPAMCALAARRGYRVFLLGSSPGVAARAAERLVEAHPGLQIAGIEHGYFPESREAEVIDRVRESRSDMLIVAFGTPKQEFWLTTHREALGVPVMIGVGSSLDRISGDVKSPPAWMTDVGLEWLYRTFQEPGRLGRRYLLEDPVFIGLVVRQWLQRLSSR